MEISVIIAFRGLEEDSRAHHNVFRRRKISLRKIFGAMRVRQGRVREFRAHTCVSGAQMAAVNHYAGQIGLG